MKRTSILARLNTVFYTIAVFVVFIACLFAYTSYQIQSLADQTLQFDFPLESNTKAMRVAHKSMQSNAAEYLLGHYEQKEKYRKNIGRLSQAQKNIIEQKLLNTDQQIAIFNQIVTLTKSINLQYIEHIFEPYNPSYKQAAKNITDNLLRDVATPLENIIDKRAQDEIQGAKQTSSKQELINDDIPAIQYYLQLVDEAGDMQNALTRYLLNDISAKQDFEANAASFKQWYALLQPLEQDKDEIKDLQVIWHHFSTFLNDGYRLFELYDPNDYNQAIAHFELMKQNQLSDLERQLNKLTASSQLQVSQQLTHLSTINTYSSILLIVLSIAAIMMLISMRIYASKTIYAPIATLASAVELLRQGHREIDLQHNNDELGDVFVNVAHFQDDLQQLDQLQEKEKLHKQQLEQEHEKLKQALEDLQLAKDKLVTSEKMASLGALVAGVSHEINTPIGIAVTMNSTFDLRLREFLSQARDGDVTLDDLEEFEQESLEGLKITQRALERAAELIRSFKQVAVDQSSEVKRTFNLKEVLTENINTLKHQIKNTQHTLTLNCSEEINLSSYPGPLGQVITNLFNNSILHGFDDLPAGNIIIDVNHYSDSQIILTFSDDGRGIASEHINKVFDPFFTTKLGKGGSGLGMNIVYNIVNGVLGGVIHLSSKQQADEHGTTITIIIPREAP